MLRPRRLVWCLYVLILCEGCGAFALDDYAVRQSTSPRDLGRLAVTYQHLASLHHDAGSYDDAEMFYIRSITAWEKAFGREDAGLVRLLNDLASLYLDAKQYGKAERTCERSLRIGSEGVAPLDRANTLVHLGGVYRALARYEKAEAVYLQAEAIVTREVGPGTAEAANIWNNLGVLYASRKMLGKAGTYFDRAFEIFDGSCSPGGALMLTNIATVYGTSGRSADADRAFRRARDCARSAFGPEHPQTADVLSRYGAFLRKAKRKQEAAELESQAKAIREIVARGDRSRFVVDAADLHAADRNAH